jgi:hypothetical protein
MPSSSAGPPFDQFLATAEAVAQARPEVDLEMAREVFREAAILLPRGPDRHDCPVSRRWCLSFRRASQPEPSRVGGSGAARSNSGPSGRGVNKPSQAPMTGRHRAGHFAAVPPGPTCRPPPPRPLEPAGHRRAVPLAHTQKARPKPPPAPATPRSQCLRHLPALPTLCPGEPGDGGASCCPDPALPSPPGHVRHRPR